MIDKKIKAESKCQAAEKSKQAILNEMQILKEYKQINEDDIRNMR